MVSVVVVVAKACNISLYKSTKDRNMGQIGTISCRNSKILPEKSVKCGIGKGGEGLLYMI